MSIRVTWVDLVSGENAQMPCRKETLLAIVKVRVLARLGVPQDAWDERVVKSSVRAGPLDESETLSQLGVADGAVLFVDEGKTKVRLKFVNIETSEDVEGEFFRWRPLRAAKSRALAMLGVLYPEWAQYVVKESPRGESLDESENLDDLGIDADGKTLFLAKA